jgi:hypothetical protein
MMDDWRKNYPAAFSRAYNPAYGRVFEAWLAEGDK